MSEISSEILKKAKLIELKTKKILDEALSGGFKSPFKGQGLQFAEHRVYVPGDDVRHIDWKVSARTKEPLIKKYDEERELSVFLVVDQSSSGVFGTSKYTKYSAIQEVAALIAYTTFFSSEKVGLLTFNNEVKALYPPKKGKSHLNRILGEIFHEAEPLKKTNLTSALEKTDKLLKHASIIFILSDFQCENYEKYIRKLSRKHEVIAIRLKDENELNLPNLGTIPICDSESGQVLMVDTGSYRFKEWQKKELKNFEENIKSLFKKTGIEELLIETKNDPMDAVVHFFGLRARK